MPMQFLKEQERENIKVSSVKVLGRNKNVKDIEKSGRSMLGMGL